MTKPKKKCPDCGSLSVENVFDGEAYCKTCHLHCLVFDLADASVFDHIIVSPEVLAEKLVYDWGHLCHNGDIKIYWKSTILPDAVFSSKVETITATLAKLKEVCDE